MTAAPLATDSGIGLKAQHCAELLATLPCLPFVEIHAENYMGDGGPPHRRLTAIRAAYPVSMHGVGLSLGSDAPLDDDHLAALARLVNRYQPALVSEHLAWSSIDGTYLNDLLPIPYTEASLAVVARHVDQLQDCLGRQVLIENPSAYLGFAATTMGEAEFLAALVENTDCGLLLDVNNLFVSAANLGFDAETYLDTLPGSAIGEFHLAGHHLRNPGPRQIRIDDHGSKVCPEVWALYRRCIARFGMRPTLIEWDTDVPALAMLLGEARRADREAAAVAAERAVA